MVSLQVLLVNIMKRHEIRQVLKIMFNLEKRTVYIFYLGDYELWEVFDIL
jgi:hypothetical protein